MQDFKDNKLTKLSMISTRSLTFIPSLSSLSPLSPLSSPTSNSSYDSHIFSISTTSSNRCVQTPELIIECIENYLRKSKETKATTEEIRNELKRCDLEVHKRVGDELHILINHVEANYMDAASPKIRRQNEIINLLGELGEDTHKLVSMVRISTAVRLRLKRHGITARGHRVKVKQLKNAIRMNHLKKIEYRVGIENLEELLKEIELRPYISLDRNLEEYQDYLIQVRDDLILGKEESRRFRVLIRQFRVWISRVKVFNEFQSREAERDKLMNDMTNKIEELIRRGWVSKKETKEIRDECNRVLRIKTCGLRYAAKVGMVNDKILDDRREKRKHIKLMLCNLQNLSNVCLD